MAIDEREANEILGGLDKIETPHSPDRRAHERHAFRQRPATVRIKQPGVSGDVICDVFTRNLSQGGVSFLNDGYLPVGSECTIQLPALKASWTDNSGVVVGCRLVRRDVYEVALQFDQSVDLSLHCSLHRAHDHVPFPPE